MKTILMVFFLILLPNALKAQIGWFLLDEKPLGASTGIEFPSNDTGYYFGSGDFKDTAFFKVTFDGGKSWENGNAPFTKYLHEPYHINNENVFFIDGDSALVKTIDAGKSWQRIAINFSEFPFTVNNVSFPSASTGYLCCTKIGYKGFLLKSIDSGHSWTKILGTDIDNFYRVTFRDSIHGYVYVEHNFPLLGAHMLYTSDGGLSWNKTDIVGGQRLHYDNVQNIWIGLVTHSVGRWNENLSFIERVKILDSTKNESLTAMEFADDTLGYVSTSEGRIFKTTNGGVSWFLQKTPAKYTGSYDTWICAPSRNVAYAFDFHVIIKTIDGGGDLINSIRSNVPVDHSLFIDNNPTHNSANFWFAELTEQTRFQLFDILGSPIFNEHLPAGKASLHVDMQKYPSGIYLARLGNETVRFIKE